MKTNLAWRNLTHECVRSAIAAAGVAFAVVLIFMQLGFLRALEHSATQIYDALNFDVCIRSKDYLQLAEPRTFPRQRLYQALSSERVAEAHPFYLGLRLWRNPRSGEKIGILVLGARPADRVFRDAALQDTVERTLTAPDRVLVDVLTRPEFGPANGGEFSAADIGQHPLPEVSMQGVEIAGLYRLGAGFAATGSVLTSEAGFLRLSPGFPAGQTSLGLLRLHDPTPFNIAATVAELRQTLPDDVEVYSRKDVLEMERRRWVTETSYGLIFQLGISVALIVGTAIVYQVLSSDVANLLPEYATLKAMGYGNGYLAGVVLQQAAALSLMGFAPGYGVARCLYVLTGALTKIPMTLSWYDFLVVLILAVLMCGLSGLGAAWRVFRADPASLF